MTDFTKRLAALSPEKRNALLQQLKREVSEKRTTETIPVISRENNAFPLSFSQQRLWVLDQLEPGNPAYNISGAIRLTGELNNAALERSFTEIVRRHEALRTTFSSFGEQPIQVIHPPKTFPVPFVDLIALPEAKREIEARKLIAAEALHPFNLNQGPLIRTKLYKLTATDHILVLVIHHIVADGWSLSVLVKELSTLYAAFDRDLPSPLPELAVQYVDYSAFQHTSLQGEQLEHQLDYWQRQLCGDLPILQLPVDHPHLEMRTYRGASCKLEFSQSLTEKLKTLSRQEGKTFFMILLAAFKILLHRYSGQNDLVVGSPIANRNRLEIEGLIGYFLNMLALRTNLSGNPSFRKFLEQVQQVTMAAYENQDIPIEKVVEEIHPSRVLDRNPLFQVAFIYQNLPPIDIKLGNLTISQWEIENQVASLDLSFYLHEANHRLVGTIEYDRELFNEATIAKMLTHYQTLLENIVANPDQRISELSLVSRDGNVESSFSLSPMQEGMLFHTLQSENAGVYIEQMVMDFNEEINVAIFLESWKHIVKRHPILRTRFEWIGNEQPLQLVYKQSDVKLDQYDWRGLSKEEQEDRFNGYLAQDRKSGFELTGPSLMRLALFAMTPTKYCCVWTFHHSILDGRSFTIVLKELFSIYDALCEHRNWSVDSPRPYQEFVEWLRHKPLDDAKSFWQEYLNDFTDPNTLSFGFGDAQRMGYGEQKVRLSQETTTALDVLAQQYQLTLNTLLQGAWAIVLSHYTGENDIIYGATRSGRHFPLEGAEDMVGLFINTLPVRIKLSPDMSLIDLLKTIREQSIATRPYEHTPLHKIQEWSEVPHGSQLFDSILVFENYLLNTSLQGQGGNWEKREFKLLERTDYPLTLAGYADSKMLLTIEYELARFDHDTIRRLLDHLKRLLDLMANTSLQGTLRDFPLLSDEERRQLLVQWSNPHTQHISTGCIHELFEAQVKQTPQAIAIATENGQLTYEELNRKANQLARYLNSRGAVPETVIGICMERSLDMIVGILGVMKAGAAYLPFDPSHPQERISFALNDSQAPFLLTQGHLFSSLPDFDGSLIHLDQVWSTIAQEETSDPHYPVQEHNLAYIIYTSGSTGKPKGVMIEHCALVQFTEAANAIYHIGPADRVLQFASLSFDASAEEIYTTLTRGATLVLRDDEMLVSAGSFLRKCVDWKLTVLDLPTAYWHQLTGELNKAEVKFPESLRLAIIGGEKAQPASVMEWFRRAPNSIRLVNTYGPTEATVVATTYEYSAEMTSQNSLIGRPLENTSVYILDQYLQPVPIGVAGELFIGGGSLARGYLHQQELTAEKFIADPFSDRSMARLYRTGDRARYIEDGNIEFLGRVDEQVKIRGFRVELGEIEAVLGKHPNIQENVVLVREDIPGEKYLVAYFVSSQNISVNISDLRSFLRGTLPDYMIPASFVKLDTMPLTQSGKVNRRALPTPDRSRNHQQEQLVAARDDIEKTVESIFANVLNVEQVGIFANFFDMGGHSLLATRVLSRINENFAIRLSLKNFFMSPTIAGISETVKTILWAVRDQSGTSSIPTSEREEIEL